jgi:c-di-GMP-binding flagellar brake protein YcgR
MFSALESIPFTVSAPHTTEATLATSDNAIAYSNIPTIIRILDEARGMRVTLTIKLEQDQRTHVFHTRIQQLNELRLQAVLHRLSPGAWQQLITGTREVEVSCQLPTGLLYFRTTIAPFDNDPGNPYCVLAIPGILYKHQLRSSYRVNLPPGSSHIALPLGSRVLNGYCLNLSLEGCCAIFRGDLDLLERDDKLPKLTLSLDDDLQFSTAATVCRKSVLQNGSTQLGLRFAPLGGDLQRKLQTSLTSLQRRQLRKYS